MLFKKRVVRTNCDILVFLFKYKFNEMSSIRNVKYMSSNISYCHILLSSYKVKLIEHVGDFRKYAYCILFLKKSTSWRLLQKRVVHTKSERGHPPVIRECAFCNNECFF